MLLNFIFKLYIFILGFLYLSFARAGSGENHWNSTLSTGYTQQSFSGDSSADFSQIKHYLINFEVHWVHKKYCLGVGYSTLPSINIQEYILTSGEVGSYKLSFSQIFLTAGMIFNKMIFEILLGSESAQWTGTPELGYISQSKNLMGFQFAYDAYKKNKFTFPVGFRYWSKPQRNMNFKNNPQDTIIVTPGSEFVLSVGARYEFR